MRVRKALADNANGRRSVIRIGCAGWNYKQWKTEVYDGAPQREWLRRYAERFSTVEVNATFYRLPLESTVATWAEQPQSPPNYIFPFMSLTYFSIANISEFQYLMYRPLYWFGNGTTPGLNENLSLADQPAYTNNNSTLTLNLKDYKWSNGETVTTQDIMFFLNMLHAQKANWAAYAPGGASIPDSIKSVTIDSPTQMTLQLTTSVNTFWYTYNQLGQITPFPMAWDKTSQSGAPGSGGCSSAGFGTADTACTAARLCAMT